MKLNPSDSFEIGTALKPDAYTAAAYVPVTNTAVVHLKNAGGVTFLVDVGTVGSSGTIAAKIQRSTTGLVSTFSDQPAGQPGNDTAGATITATGVQRLSINNPDPAYPYYALHVTIGVATSDVGASYVKGPLRNVEPS